LQDLTLIGLFSTSLSEFAKRTRLRADTALALISDSEFQVGQMAIEESGALETQPEPVIETIELLVFRTNATRSMCAP
jgi:hypothetical protein